jgi:hypothetical protein
MKPLLFIGIGVALYGGYCLVASPRVRQQAAVLPRVSCEQLIRKGPAGNRYVVLTDLSLSDRKSVSEWDGETGALEMYHGVYPAQLEKEPDPRDLAVVLALTDELARRHIRDDRNARKEQGQRGLGELTVEVSRADKLPKWAREGLAAEYPGIRLADCWLVATGGYEPTAERAAHLLWHGCIAIPAAAVMILIWWRWRDVPWAAD